MKNFTYYRPATLEQAASLLADAWGKTELLAGGTDLLDLQKEYVAQPERVVSLADVKGLGGIEVRPDNVAWIGAAARLGEIAEHADLRKALPALCDAASQVAGPQIRNMATLGGNLCQRNRCWYFRDEHVHCLLKGGPKCFALDGDNQYHAVFTKDHKCVMVHPSTLAPVLIALGASADVVGPKGRRRIELANFFQAPSAAGEREHVLAANEIIVGVSIPIGARNGSYEVRHKQAYDWPLVQAAAAFKLQGGKAVSTRIVLGHVAPTPHLAVKAMETLDGKELNEANAELAGKAATEGARPLSGNAYKLRLIEVAVKRAVLLAAGVKPYWEE